MTTIEKITRQVEKPWIQIALLVLLCGIIYGQAFGFGYVFDDIYQFETQHDLRSGPLSWHALSKSILVSEPYFRPLVMLTWFSEFHLLGLRPSISHGINIFIFCCNILLVRSVTLVALKRRALSGNIFMRSWLAAVIYAVHPALIEAAVWVSGRFDLLCTLFILLAVRFFLVKESKILVQFLGVFICSLLALFCKELGIVLTGTLFCVAMAAQPDDDTTRHDTFWRDALNIIVRYQWGFYGVVCSLPVYFIIRSFSMEMAYSSRITFSYLYSSIIQQKLPLEAMRLYTGLTLLPSVTGISFFRDYADRSAWTFVSSLITLLMIAAVIWMSIKGKKWAWLIMAGFTGLVLVIHIIPIRMADNIVQDRFLSMPLAFFTMAAVSVKWINIFDGKSFWIEYVNKKFIFGFVFTAWLALCTATTLSALPTWKNNILWWSTNYKLAHHHRKEDDIRLAYIETLFFAGLWGQVIDITDPEVKSGKNINVFEFFYYARALQAKGDPRADGFIDQVIHKLDNSQIPQFSASNTTPGENLLYQRISTVYTDYAFTMMASGNIDSAVQYSNIGMKYAPEQLRFRSALAIMLGNYLNNDFNGGWNIFKNYANQIDTGNYVATTKQLASNYCNNLASNEARGSDAYIAACARLKSSDFFRVQNFFGPIP